MKKLLLLILFLCSVKAEAAITKIVQVGCASVGGANCTTGAVNATGGNFIAIVLSDASSGTTTLSDSSSNSYTQCGPTEVEAGFATRMRIYYKAGAAVSASMTFTATASSSFPAILVGVFSGVNSVAPCDQTAGNFVATQVSTFQFGSVTPTVNNELVISGLGVALATSATTVNSSFVNTNTANVDVEPAVSSNNYGVSFGYLIQTTAAAVNPTWSWTSTTTVAGVNATFFATGTGPTGANSSLMLVGVGQ